MCERLVKQMGGEIGCQSNPGTGSVFWIEIPLVLAEMPQPIQEGPSRDPGRPASRQRLRILVVDDVKVNRDVAGALLANMGHDVSFAVGGNEALEKLNNFALKPAPPIRHQSYADFSQFVKKAFGTFPVR